MSSKRATLRIGPKGEVRLPRGPVRLLDALRRFAQGRFAARFVAARRRAALSGYETACVGAQTGADPACSACTPDGAPISTTSRLLP